VSEPRDAAGRPRPPEAPRKIAIPSPEQQAELRSRLADAAQRLAVNADEVARTMLRRADFHGAVAGDPAHPLCPGSAEHAQVERDFATKELRMAERLRGVSRDLAAGLPWRRTTEEDQR
jgi:hypothetical protein